MPPLPKNDKPIDITQIAQVLGVAKHILAGFGVQPPFGAVLAAVSFVRNHHNIAAGRQQRVGFFSVQQRKFLHRGEQHAADLP